MKKSYFPKHLNEVQLSKKLSWLLRHGALQADIKIQANGYVSVNEILHHPQYAPYYTLEVLQKIVAADQKQRFALQKNPDSGSYEIRANQGHSLDVVTADESLQKITNPHAIPLAIHGTYYRHWPSIRKQGLRRLKRNHIHFAVNDKPQPGSEQSGFRSNCEILIYLDVKRAMEQGGCHFYRSNNNVILCAGIGPDGCIPKDYFAKVMDRRTGEMLEL